MPLSTPSRAADNVAQTVDDAAPYRYRPISLSIHSRRRFNTRRKREYMAEIVGRPSRWQLAAVESLLRREWMAIVAERSGDPDMALRADHEYQRLLADFRRSIQPAPAAQPSLSDVLATIVARRQSGEAA